MKKRGDRMSDNETENELFLTQSTFKTVEKEKLKRLDRCFIRLYEKCYEKYKLLCPKTLSEGRDAARVYKRASDDQKAAVPEILAKATRTESAPSTVVPASNIVTELNTAPKP